MSIALFAGMALTMTDLGTLGGEIYSLPPVSMTTVRWLANPEIVMANITPFYSADQPGPIWVHLGAGAVLPLPSTTVVMSLVKSETTPGFLGANCSFATTTHP